VAASARTGVGADRLCQQTASQVPGKSVQPAVHEDSLPGRVSPDAMPTGLWDGWLKPLIRFRPFGPVEPDRVRCAAGAFRVQDGLWLQRACAATIMATGDLSAEPTAAAFLPADVPWPLAPASTIQPANNLKEVYDV